MDIPDSHPYPMRSVQARRISTADPAQKPIEEEVGVVLEAPLHINVEAIEDYTVLCTPGDARAMAAGFLFCEGVIDGMDDVAWLKECEDDPQVVRVRLNTGMPRIADPGRNLLIVSSCGACGTEDFNRKMYSLPTVGDTLEIESTVLRFVSREILKSQPLFAACGSTHAAGLFDKNGRIISCAEDTGRHNALDKAIGKCLLSSVPVAGLGAMLSSRVSLEMVGKCARAGIELISAVSAPTSLAIDVAGRCDITLCAFVRETRATVFTHPRRVLGAG